jgi:hypothetical protein
LDVGTGIVFLKFSGFTKLGIFNVSRSIYQSFLFFNL